MLLKNMTLNFLLSPFFLILLRLSAGFSSPEPNSFYSLLPSDAVALLSFKSTADLDNKLLYSLTERYDYCQWRGVKCAQGRVVRLVLSGVGLRGYFSSASLSRLDQLRVLSLENNSLFGPIPDLSTLVNLKSIFLRRNVFSGTFPPSILSLHRLMVLSLSFNNFTGPIPSEINALERLTSLNLEFNHFNGTLPPLNQSFLTSFNVSGNNLTGVIPATPTLLRFDASSFKSNTGLCGEIINRACASRSPFFGSTNKTSSSSSQAPLGQSAQAQNGGAVVISPVISKKKGKESVLVLGFTVGLASLIVLGLCLVVFSLVMKKRNNDGIYEPSQKGETSSSSQQQHQAQTPRTRSVPILNSNSNSNSESQKREVRSGKEDNLQLQSTELQSRIPNSGNLVFCGVGGESSEGMYSLEQLMRASAELLGRGSVGITYKAVLDNQLIVTVKRLDAAKTAVTSEEAFENHLKIVGGLRHSNLVPIRSYFQSNGERLIIYDYQPNGSLFNLIHGSRSSRAKPLHWTSCLKIAEDVAQGLYYIHQSSSGLVHGNLKSTNILLGQDFEACLTDYCLSVLIDSSSSDDPDSSSYKAPEIRKSSRRPTSKCDVYSFGVLIFELLTGKNASRHPFMAPHDMLDWVRAMRDEEEGGENNRLGMMTETACLCRVTSPEQRPTMRQVITMIQEIKESVMTEENDPFQ